VEGYARAPWRMGETVGVLRERLWERLRRDYGGIDWNVWKVYGGICWGVV